MCPSPLQGERDVTALLNTMRRNAMTCLHAVDRISAGRGYHGRMRIRGLLLDLDGTLYVGEEPVEGAREANERLQTSGLALRYVTNTTRRTLRWAVCEQLRSLGFEVDEAEIFTPARAAAGLIGDRSCFPPVDESLLEDLRELTLDQERPDHVLVGDLGEGFTYDRLNAAFRLLEGAELCLAEEPLLAHAGRAVSGRRTVCRSPRVRERQERHRRGKARASFLPPGPGGHGARTTRGRHGRGRHRVRRSRGTSRGAAGDTRQDGYRPEAEGEPDLVLESVAGLPEVLG